MSLKAGSRECDVRFGSQADMCSAQGHVRFTPNSDRESGHQKIADLSWEALVEDQLNKQHELIPRERKAFDRFDKEGEPLMKEPEAVVQERLWSNKIE